jgi:hypothetical protein
MKEGNSNLIPPASAMDSLWRSVSPVVKHLIHACP